MMDAKKVIKGLKCHAREGICGMNCPYEAPGNCSEQLCADALAIIRKQQERIKELEAAQTARLMTVEEVADAEEGTVVWCEAREPGGTCLNAMVCGGDGHIATFYLGISLEDLANRNYRFWTQRPTDEQMEAVAWQ